MSTLVGLLPHYKHIDAVIQKLSEFGIPEEHIELRTNENEVKKLFQKKQSLLFIKCVVLGTIAGTAVLGFITLALTASWCECGPFQFNHILIYKTPFIGVITSALLGGIVGGYLGKCLNDGYSSFYIEEVRAGNQLLVANIEDENLAMAINCLHQAGCFAVRDI